MVLVYIRFFLLASHLLFADLVPGTFLHSYLVQFSTDVVCDQGRQGSFCCQEWNYEHPYGSYISYCIYPRRCWSHHRWLL